LVVPESSLLVAQVSQDTFFEAIQVLNEIAKIADNHVFCENNRILSGRSEIKNGNQLIRYYSKLLGGGKNDWIDILEEIKYYINYIFQTYFQSVDNTPEFMFYEKYYQVRNDILQRLKDKRIFIDTRKVKKYIDEELEICKSIKEKVEIYKEDPNDPEIPTYPEFDPST
jgi:hypothetical protein